MKQDSTSLPLIIRTEPAMFLEREEVLVEDSIDSILDLIVFTPKGSFSADPEFGFEYWNYEFSNVNVREFNNSYLGMLPDSGKNQGISRKECEASLRESILVYEPRLHKPDVKVEIDINGNYGRKSNYSKYEMKILITGLIDDGLGVSRAYEKRIAFIVEPIARKFRI